MSIADFLIFWALEGLLDFDLIWKVLLVLNYTFIFLRSSPKDIQRDLLAYRSVCDLNQQPMYSCETLRLYLLMRLIWIWMSYQGRAPSYRPKCISFSRKIRAEDYWESEIVCVIQLHTKREQNHETWISQPWITFLFQETLKFSFYMLCSKYRRARGSWETS